MKNYRIINLETGEIVTDEVAYFRTDTQQENYRRISDKEKHSVRTEGEKFVNSHMERIKELRTSVDDTMLGYALLLLPSLKYDGTLGTSKRSFTKVKEFESVFRVTDRQAKKVIKTLLDAQVIYQNEEGVYCMNQAYHWKGAIRSKDVKQNVKVMTDGIKLLQESGVKARSLGVIYSLLPFINYSKNMITHNPYESDNDKVEPMSLESVAEVVGIHSKKVSGTLRSITFIADDGRPMYGFATVEVGREKHIIINPMLVRRVAESNVQELLSDNFLSLFLICRPDKKKRK